MASSEPIYTPFFGAMGATAAMSFSGEFMREIVKNMIGFLLSQISLNNSGFSSAFVNNTARWR
jgi:hypothetical protein